jgi:D-serine deaminase-like pyridoxal phosphate-dependent protein
MDEPNLLEVGKEADKMLATEKSSAAAMIGMHKSEIDTPALLLDLATMERNLQRMAAFTAAQGINLRPHVKTYKGTPELAHLQLQAGAIGMTCVKLAEAEVLVASGVTDILIANEVVGPKKLQRLAALANQCDIKVAVDNPYNVAALSEAAQANGVTIGVLVELNIGQNRCGVAPFAPALELTRLIAQMPGLNFRGLMGYDGHATMRASEQERGPLSRQAYTLLVETKKLIEEAGFPVEIVSGGGTFTYRYASEVKGITEVQTGTYLLMDSAFQDHGVREFDRALSILTTIVSKASYPGGEGLVIVDAGRKSASPHYGLPEVKFPAQGAAVRSLSDEHGRIMLEGEAQRLQVGDQIELWVRDANGTTSLFDRFYAMRNDHVEAVWHIPNKGINT